jgi:hypothetical protein
MAFNFSINPQTFQSMQIGTKAEQTQFLFKLSQLLGQITANINTIASAAYLSGLLNGSATLAASALLGTVVDLGTVTGNQTVNTNGGLFNHIRIASATTQTVTLTLQNLAQGAYLLVFVDVTGSHTLTIKLAATDPSSHVYTATAYTSTNGTETDLVGTGVGFTGGTGVAGYGILWGMSGFIGTNATPTLNMAFID